MCEDGANDLFELKVPDMGIYIGEDETSIT